MFYTQPIYQQPRKQRKTFADDTAVLRTYENLGTASKNLQGEFKKIKILLKHYMLPGYTRCLLLIKMNKLR